MSLTKPVRELSVEETFRYTFNIYALKFLEFFIPFLVAGVIIGAFTALINNYIQPVAPSPHAPPDVFWSQFWNFLASVLLVVILMGIVSWIVGTIASGICVKLASDFIEKGNTSLQESFHYTMTRLPSLLPAGVITGILTVLGFLALIIPGIIIAIMFSLAVPAILLERLDVLKGLGRSRRLVSNRWLKTFVLLLIVGIVILAVSGIANFVTTPLGIAGSLISSIIAAFVQPILPIALTLYYYSMLARETLLQPPPPPPAL